MALATDGENRMTGEQEARRAMVDTCRRMNAAGLNQGTSGNLSVRAGDGLLVTPTSLPYDVMEPDDIVPMGFDGRHDGPRRPSSEWRFHADILRLRTDVDCVLHCHATYATTLACHHRGIPSFHYMVAVAGGTTIRCAPYATFGTQDLSDHALAALEGRRACLLGQHGLIALGATPAAALALAVEVEALARLYLQALALGEPPVLPDDEMERVFAQMRRIGYGQTPGTPAA
jgi:L-fuculose-phosphate aldolase